MQLVPDELTWQGARDMAAQSYPDPPKPREAHIGHTLYRVVDGVIERMGTVAWFPSSFKATDIRALHDLLENPTE
jgi:hypothetical protein